MGNFIGVLKNVDGSCPSLKQPIPCNFTLYTNATHLTNTEKLLPNTDIEGSNILVVFVVTRFLAAGLALILLLDEATLLSKSISPQNNKFYRRIIHGVDTLLHSLSDSQVVAGLALLIVVIVHANCISAYHYDAVCYLMLMSLITHILVFVNVPDFCAKSIFIGIGRILSITAIFGMTWSLFKAQDDIHNFPVSPKSLAIMPAAYYKSSGTSGGNNRYTNQFLPLAVFGIFGLIFLLVDSLKIRALEVMAKSYRVFRLAVLGIRTSITIALIGIAINATVDYFQLRNGFENSEFYIAGDEDTASMSQAMTITLSILSLFAILKACSEPIDGPRNEKAIEEVIGKLQTGYLSSGKDSSAGHAHDLDEDVAMNLLNTDLFIR